MNDQGNDQVDDRGGAYYAVIFTAEMADDMTDYPDTAAEMVKLVETQPGYIGMHQSIEGNQEITISYWDDLDSIKAWKQNPEHLKAQELGKSKWYAEYAVQIVKIDKFYQSYNRKSGGNL